MSEQTDLSPYQAALKQVQASPQDADAWEALGDLLAERGEARKAADCYRRVLDLRPDDIEAQINLAALPLESAPQSGKEPIAVHKLLEDFSLPLWFQVFLGLFSFLMTFILASAQRWEVTDLVWSLWISSLMLGYSYLLIGIVSMTLHSAYGLPTTNKLQKVSELLQPSEGVRWTIAIVGGVFTIGFFSVHFLFFHYIHSVFLNLFFPIYGSGSSAGFPPFLPVIGLCLKRYWPVILLSAATQLPNFIHVAQTTNSNFISMPYRNVIKMHISIFVFAGLSFANISSLTLYYLLILYYFPYEGLFQFLRQGKKPREVQAAD